MPTTVQENATPKDVFILMMTYLIHFTLSRFYGFTSHDTKITNPVVILGTAWLSRSVCCTWTQFPDDLGDTLESVQR